MRQGLKIKAEELIQPTEEWDMRERKSNQTTSSLNCAWIFLCSASVGAPGSVPAQTGWGPDLVNEIPAHGNDFGAR